MKKKLLILCAIGIIPISSFGQTSSNSCAEADGMSSISANVEYNVPSFDGIAPSTICITEAPPNGEWFKYTPTEDYFVYVTSELPQNFYVDEDNLSKDTRVHIYSGNCGGLVCLAGDDDDGHQETSRVGFNVQANQTYYIAWDNLYDSRSFDFKLVEIDPNLPVSFTSALISAPGIDRGAVDMNGDFLDDLVSVYASSITVNTQQPNGSFVETSHTTNGTYTAGWSMAAGDYDRNGYNDLVYGNSSGAHVVKANSNGTGYSIAATSHSVFTQRTNFVDFDNDGNLDVFLCDDTAPNEYFINDGTDLTLWEGDDSNAPIVEGLGLFYSGGNYGSVWVDYDNDGDQDLFIAKCGGEQLRRKNELFRNNGNLSFTDVSNNFALIINGKVDTNGDREVDVNDDTDNWLGSGYNVIDGSIDVDGDGSIADDDDDITNHSLFIDGIGYNVYNSKLDFDNDGDGDNSDDGVTVHGIADPISTWSSAWADFDNDGDMDCFVGSSLPSEHHKLMKNRLGVPLDSNGSPTDGDPLFEDITSSALADGYYSFGHENVPYDFNNDGYVDIFSNGSILFNKGDGAFIAYSNDVPQDGAVGDLNNDGFLDVFRSGKIYYNDGNSNNWLKVALTGTISNINGIGARIEVSSPSFNNGSSNKSQIRDLRSAEGFAYMNSLNAHFGLGTDATVDTVTIYWPSGTVDIVVNPNINDTLIVIEGETLSLQSTITNDLILYPNPTKRLLNINSTYGFENAIFSVFDMTGRRVLNDRFNSNTIDVSELSTGNYILRIIDNGVIKTQKFIKQ